VVGVDVFDDFLYPAAPKRKNAQALAHGLSRSAFRLIEADIRDAGAMRDALAGADRLCHLAALAGVRPSLRDPSRYVRYNIEGTLTLFEAARAADVVQVAFASSSSVYGVRDKAVSTGFREDDPCLSPASPYGASKRAGELYCSTYRDLYGFGVSALRFFTVYGPRQRPDMAIHKFVRAAYEGSPISMFGDGSSRRDYTYIDDIVSGTVAAVERVERGAYRVYNLGGTHTTSLSELIDAVRRVTGRELAIEHLPDQPGDVPITFADISCAARDLDYQPTTDLETGVGRFWDWFQREAT
jgi:UDP-glucuronate 4-epimerase